MVDGPELGVTTYTDSNFTVTVISADNTPYLLLKEKKKKEKKKERSGKKWLVSRVTCYFTPDTRTCSAVLLLDHQHA